MGTSFWGEQIFTEDDAIQYLSAGNLHLWMKTHNKDIWIGHRYTRDGDHPYSEQPPEDLEWARWSVSSGTININLSPVFPDRPVVVFYEYPLKVLPNVTLQMYTRIPVWVRISLAKSGYMLTELPTVKLSKTWFGTPVEGELCYWSATKARRSLSGVEKKSYVINCPIKITNKSSEDLDFDKFCFRVEQLKIFDYEEALWADETLITYQGEEMISNITMTGKLPAGMGDGTLLNGPRNHVRRNLAARTFYKIFDEPFNLGR